MQPPMQQHQQQGPVLQQQQLRDQSQPRQLQQTGKPKEQQQQAPEQAAYPGYLHERRPGDKVHFCMSCQTPIAVYGRLTPCLHVFCLACASDMPQCFICRNDINRIDRHTTTLYISAASLQSFTTEAQLHGHTQRLYNHLKRDPQFAMQLQPTASRSLPAAAAAAAAAAGGSGTWAGRMNAAAAAAAAAGQV